MLTLLNNHGASNKLSGKTNFTWILDSTCSYYITDRRELFENLQAVGPYIIRLSNGAEAVASEQGTICLSPEFIAHNLLFIPELKCN